MHTIPYIPDRCGAIFQEARTSVYGVALDYSQALIALAVLAPATTIEKIHFTLQSQEAALSIMRLDSNDRYNRTVRSVKYHFRTRKTAIPDTSDVSLILLNDSLFAPIKDMVWTHVWYHSEEQFKLEVFQRVRQIVYDPVKVEWAGYLAMYGASTEYDRKPLCGRLQQRDGQHQDWMSAGFSVGYILNSREQWEAMIEKGLTKGLIKFR